MNNAVFRKTMKNISKHRNIKLITSQGAYLKAVMKPNFKSGVRVHVQNFGGVASRVPWGLCDSFGKTGNLAAWVTKVCLKCTEKLGYGGRVTFDNIFKSS